MKRQGLIEIWHDEKILGGDRWQEEIFSIHIPTSDLLLYLVSAESLASENCYKELEIALKKGIRVIPIIFADCDWKNDQLSDFQGFPDNGLPITKWNNESEGWENVVDGIRKTISKLESQANPSFGGTEKDLQAELAFERGNIRLLREELDEAIEAYSQSIDLMPQVASSYNNRGVVYWRKGDFDRAIEDFGTAIKIKSDFAEAYHNRGSAYGKKGVFDRAIVDYTKAIELKPDYADAYYRRSKSWLHLGETEKAKADMKTASNIGINSGTALDETLRNYDRAWKILGNL